jgi:hypothetical protein
MMKAERMAMAGALLATVISMAAFFGFPPGLMLGTGNYAKARSDEAFMAGSATSGFRPANKEELPFAQLLTNDTSKLERTSTGVDLSLLAGAPGQKFTTSLLTQEFITYTAASAAITSLSWTEEDVVIPLYRSALNSAVQLLTTIAPDAVSARKSVDKVDSVLTIAARLLDGESYSRLPADMKAYFSSLGLANPLGLPNPESLFESLGSERFRYSTNLTRFQASVIWVNYATGFERSQDLRFLAVLGFVVANNISAWSRLASFYSGLFGLDSMDSSHLASVAVSVFGQTLTEEKLTDATLLAKFSDLVSGEAWDFPFRISIHDVPMSLILLTQNLPPSANLTQRISELRSSRLADSSGMQVEPTSLPEVWFSQILTAPWNASNDRTVKAILGSYTLLLTSATAGMELELPSGRDVFAEANEDLYSRLDAFLLGTYRYLDSTVGVSGRVGALLVTAHDILAFLSQASGSSSGPISVGQTWREKLSLVLRVSGLAAGIAVDFGIEQTLHVFSARLLVSELGRGTGGLYVIDEEVEEG